MLQRTLLALAAFTCLAAQAHEVTKPSGARAVVAPAKANGSGVVLRYEVPPRIELHQAANVTLRLSGVDASDASVEIRAPAGLAVAPPAAAVRALPRGVETTLVLSVTPTAHGVHYLDVFTRQHGRLTAQSIAISTGTATPQHLKRAGTAQTTPSGERIVSLPAQ